MLLQKNNLFWFLARSMSDEAYSRWTLITERELKAYFGFCILMGISQLPEIEDYWSKDPLLHYSPIASRITRERDSETSAGISTSLTTPPYLP